MCSIGAYMTDFERSVQIYRENQQKAEGEICALLEECALKYNKPDSEELKGGLKWSNSRGIIATRDQKVLLKLLQKLV